MEWVFFGIWTVAVFIAQLALCFSAKKKWLRLGPAILQLVLPALCLLIYTLSNGNWAWLILTLMLMGPLMAAGAAWGLYGLVRLLQKCAKLFVV